MTERVVDLVGKLLAQAEGTDNDHEAAAFVERAQQLATEHAVDLEGVTAVTFYIASRANDGSGPRILPAELTLTSGTARDGDWTGSVTIPQGTPPDVYVSQALITDTRHYRSYSGASSPFAGTSGQLPLPGDPTVTVVDASIP